MQQKQQSWHALTAEAIAEAFSVDTSTGLGHDEVAERRSRYGPNELPEGKRRSLVGICVRQFQSPLIYILFVAAIFAVALGEHGDSAVILVVVFINAIIGTVQEGRAERSMEALRRLSALETRVLRNGKEQLIAARELVPGDVMLLEAGDAVGADSRLLESTALETAEATLTGESLPVGKQLAPLAEETLLADRSNMLYSGTHITAGHCRALVVAIGLATEVGKIAQLTEVAETPKTPLELRIAQFGRYLVGGASALFVAVMSFGLIREIPLIDIFMVAISQMVSMVPEGLPVAMTIALAVGMQRMAGRGAIVRRLAAVETLGSTGVICSDKTGTLTRNEMTVTEAWLSDGRAFEVTGAGYAPNGEIRRQGTDRECALDDALKAMLTAGALCNDAQLMPPDAEEHRWRELGDPTEAALLTLAMKGGLDVAHLRRAWHRRSELPFDSENKMMVTLHRRSDAGQRIFLKGAPEAVLSLCGMSAASVAEGGEGARLFAESMGAAHAMASRALRVLALAEVSVETIDEDAGFDQFAGQVRLLGLVGQMDPPREEVRLAVAECQSAGIRPVMVTGDHKATGLAIAQKLGIADAEGRAVDGHELESMSDQDLRADLDDIAVFARVHPAQKLRIVEAFQARGKVVAMTGDGVNDAPALARADVGVAMGITGTEVAKSAAKIVITDDNFSTIVKAVEEGRLVYSNLKKVILYLFATSMAEITVLLGALILGYPLPLAAVQILWINIVTEGTVTVNLVLEKPEGDEMRRPPVPQSESILDKALLKRVALMTPTMGLSTLAYFIWRLSEGVPYAQVQTETFTVLAACQWFNVLNCRSATLSALSLSIFNNRWLLGGLTLGIALQCLVVYAPALNQLFHTVPIEFGDFFLIVLTASTVLWVEEARKFVVRRTLRRRQSQVGPLA